jgi:hypothetical protein
MNEKKTDRKFKTAKLHKALPKQQQTDAKPAAKVHETPQKIEDCRKMKVLKKDANVAQTRSPKQTKWREKGMSCKTSRRTCSRFPPVGRQNSDTFEIIVFLYKT